VRGQVRDRLDYTFEDLGERSVKNIARPVRAYALRLEDRANVPTESGSTTTTHLSPRAAPCLSCQEPHVYG
jgi:adenylate cyclase